MVTEYLIRMTNIPLVMKLVAVVLVYLNRLGERLNFVMDKAFFVFRSGFRRGLGMLGIIQAVRLLRLTMVADWNIVIALLIILLMEGRK